VPQHAEAAWEAHSNRIYLRPSDATIDFPLLIARNEWRLGLDNRSNCVNERRDWQALR
jgi:hypothetical protein